MTRTGHVLKGLGALAILALVVVSIPWALWHFVGWPLPHHVPSAAQVGHALNHQGIPAQTLIDALAVVVWLTWTVLVASLAVEVPAALSGRRPRQLRVAGIFQPVTGRLVAAVIVACLTLAPRPAHTEPAGSTSPRIPTARRPVAALVVNDAALTSAVQPAPTVAVTAAPAPSANPAPTASAAAGSTTYVVQRGDTLWGIAQRQLGDPLRWSDIYQLNEGRPQPGGATLTDPHWIDPGWTLLLPATTAPTTLTPADAVPTAPSTAPPTPASPAPAATSPSSLATATPAPLSTAPTTAPTPPIQHNGPAQHQPTSAGSEPVRLPSGSEVAASFAAGVLATVAIGRLRRRHAYRYGPPRPGRDLALTPPLPTLRHLSRQARHAKGDEALIAERAVPVFPVSDEERRLDPGRLEIGTRDGGTVSVEVTDLSGLALGGKVVDDVVRAVIVSLLVRAVPGATEVLLTTETADRLLPGLAPNRSLRQAENSDHAARIVEAERIARTRRLGSVDASDAPSFRHHNPENPLPLLLVVLDDISDESLGRWAALLADARRLGLAIVFLGDSPAAASRVDLDAHATVTVAEGGGAVAALEGVTLYRLRPDEAVELLGAVNDANHETDEDDLADTSPHGSVTPLHGPVGSVEDGEPPAELSPLDQWWPEPTTPAPEPDGRSNPLAISALGPYRISFQGETVTTGLRSRAKLLLAWALLRPEGATIEEIVDALWPNTPPDRVLKQFWYPLGDLRTFFRGPDDTHLEVLEKIGEHYRPNPAEIRCDLWDFQAALGRAARAVDDGEARAALSEAVDAYGGDLLAGVDYLWVEPVRQDLHRRAVDAHLRLAELEEQAGRAESAAAVLEKIVDLDRYAEEPYRRLMVLQAGRGHLDAVGATWRLLQRRLTELDVDVDEATLRLYQVLTSPVPDPNSRPVRMSS